MKSALPTEIPIILIATFDSPDYVERLNPE